MILKINNNPQHPRKIRMYNHCNHPESPTKKHGQNKQFSDQLSNLLLALLIVVPVQKIFFCMNIRTHRIHGSMYIDLHWPTFTIIVYNIVGINIPWHGLLWDIFGGLLFQLFPDPPSAMDPQVGLHQAPWNFQIVKIWFPNRKIWIFPRNRGGPPKWMVKIMENLIEMDDLGG